MAFRIAAGFVEHPARRHGAGGVAARARLHSSLPRRSTAPIFFGKITIVLYWFLQVSFLGGPRLAYRLFRHSRTQHHARRSDAVPTLLVGVAADVEVLLRAIESGAVKKVLPVGILSPSPADQGQSLRGVRVRGRPENLEDVVASFASQDIGVGRLVLTPSALARSSTRKPC